MKKILLLVVLMYSCGSVKEAKDKDNNDQTYRVLQIRKKDYVYRIDAVRNDSLFVIIAVEDEKKKVGNKIQIRGNYSFDLKRIHPNERQMNYADIGVFEMAGLRIKLNKGNHWSVYLANNLDGLYLK